MDNPIKVNAAKLSEFTPDPKNANRGTERGRKMLRKSLQELGAGRSIVVDKHGTTIAGNKTAEAAISTGLDDAIVIETDGSKVVVVKRTDLDLSKDKKAKKLALADNRVGEVSLDFDPEVIAELVEEIDVSDLWDDNELAAMLDGLGLDPGSDDSGENGNDEPADENTHECPQCGHRFKP